MKNSDVFKNNTITIENSKNKNSTLVQFETENLENWLDKSFLNKLHFIFAGTQSGKTCYTTALIYAIIKNNPNLTIWTFIITETEDAIKKMQNIYPHLKNLNPNFVFTYTFKFDVAITKYEKIIEENNKVAKENKNKIFYIFYFDDIAVYLQDKRYKNFMIKYVSNSRHNNITTIMNSQIIKNVPDVIKNQLFSISILDIPSHTNLQNLYRNIPCINNIFNSEKDVTSFWSKTVKEQFKRYTIIIFKKMSSKIFIYKVSRRLLLMMDPNYEKDCMKK